MAMRACRFFIERGASLDPVDDARRIDVNAAFGQKLHHVRITL